MVGDLPLATIASLSVKEKRVPRFLNSLGVGESVEHNCEGKRRREEKNEGIRVDLLY